MTENTPMRSLPRLRRYLLTWIVGCTVLMVVAYTELLDYYVDLGIDLRTQSFLERTAQEYARKSVDGDWSDLPADPSLKAYRSLDNIPLQIRSVFRLGNLQHGEILRYMNLDLDGDNEPVTVDTLDLCPEGRCDLFFLYPYKLRDESWLYLVHGIVGSAAIYDELRQLEQVAFAIGGLFTIWFFLVSFLVIRSIDSPLRKLDRWSAALGTDSSNLEVPDLRFKELGSLANRLQFAFNRMQEGVEKEKLFLRHASHELRTPIAILSANVELLDRLTDRPERTDAEQASFVRQYRALDDVRQLIETLLWVNRQSENLPKSESINLRQEVDTIVESYRYLLDARSVSFSVEGGEEMIDAPAAAVRIVLSNLLRNAFQYTVDGDVRITLGPNEVSVENASSGELDTENAVRSDRDYGFGLGLELVTLICKRFDWHCTTQERPHGRVTVVQFWPH